jgi:protein ImuB
LAVVLPQLLAELALDSVRARTGAAKSSRANNSKLSSAALGVVVTDEKERRSTSGTGWLPGMGEAATKVELLPKTRIDAVSPRAQQFGVRSGQTIAEARALLTELQICELPRTRVEAALVGIAESLSKFASIVAFEARDSESGDSKHKNKNQLRGVGTLWLDITGIGHLYGGERELAREVLSTVRSLGHRVRVAVANGPVLAQAFACWPTRDQTLQVLSQEEVKAAVGWLPITALPVAQATQTWLARLGVLTFADLARIPRDVAAHRLGEGQLASRVLDLLRGKDDTPLRPYVPQALPVESTSFDEPITGCEPLLFALRGLVAKVCARLDGRGLAARRLRVTVFGDRGISSFRGVKPDFSSDFELVSPLYRAEELWKVLSPRLSQARLSTASIGLRLEVMELAPRQERQLSLVTADTRLAGANPEKMAVLFGRLAAEIGSQAFGVLEVADSHRPELQSVLTSVGGSITGASPELERSPAKISNRRTQQRLQAQEALRAREMLRVQETLPGLGGVPSNDVASSEVNSAPARLVEPPLQLPDREPGTPSARPFAVGEVFLVDGQRYRVEQVEFVHRIDGVEWWAGQPTSRDYHRLWLLANAFSERVEMGSGRDDHGHDSVALDVLVFLDRVTGKRFLQGFFD